MSSFRAFLLKHRLLATLLCGTPIAAIYVLLCISFETSLPWMVVTALLCFLLAYVYAGTGLANKPTVAAIKSREGCDPYPLLHLMEFLLTLRHAKSSKQIYTLNLCAALRDLGEYERVYETLRALDVDVSTTTAPQTRLIYYNNLSDVCHALGKYEEADVYHNKLLQCAKLLKGDKARARFYPILLAADADAAYRRGEYAEAIALSEKAQSAYGVRRTPHAGVCHELFVAKAKLALGETEDARTLLFSVARTADKLHAKTEAEELLASLESDAAADTPEA